MANKIFSIADGLHDELPSTTTAVAGRILITTDTGEMYYEPEDKKRVKINNADQTYTPYSEYAQSGKAVAEAVAGIVNSAPETLDTLNELAKALGDDPNFATTVVTELGKKVDKVDSVGEKSADGGEIFNDYENNKAISEFTTATGSNNIAGRKGLRYTKQEKDKDVGSTIFYFKEWSTKGYENYALVESLREYFEGKVLSIITNNEYMSYGTANVISRCSLEDDGETIKEHHIGLSFENYPFTDDCSEEGLLKTPYKNTIIIDDDPDLEIWKEKFGDLVPIVDVGTYASVSGLNNKALGYGSSANGRDNIAKGSYAFVEGRENIAIYGAHAEGRQTKALGNVSHSEGYHTESSHDYAHAEGSYTQAKNNSAHAEGYHTDASGDSSHAEGKQTTAYGIGSHSEGFGARSSGNYSHAEGFSTQAIGTNSHAEGSNTQANGENSHAEGSFSKAWKEYAHAEGYKTTASEYASHSEGANADAKGQVAHAEGFKTIASGNYSHAEGALSQAIGNTSHAEGYNTQASGECSHAGGLGTKATKVAQTAIGKYNKESEALFIIGNGTSDNNRSNAATVDWQGNAWYAGDVYVGSTSGTNKDDGSKKLATEEYIDTQIGDINTALDSIIEMQNSLIGGN